jgi:hypothetical protein
MLTLTFNRTGWYLNFSTWFMKNVLFEEKKEKLRNKQHFLENKTQTMQHVLQIQ